MGWGPVLAELAQGCFRQLQAVPSRLQPQQTSFPREAAVRVFCSGGWHSQRNSGQGFIICRRGFKPFPTSPTPCRYLLIQVVRQMRDLQSVLHPPPHSPACWRGWLEAASYLGALGTSLLQESLAGLAHPFPPATFQAFEDQSHA